MFHRLIQWPIRLAGGRERLKVIAILASVLGLDAADKGAVGAMAGPLQHAFHVGKTEIGLLLTCSLAMGAIATFPFGWLVDRKSRTHLLSWIIVAWAAAMVVSGFASSYRFLLFTRLLLGGVAACAAPAVASLLGDYFFISERGRIYGYVLSGELVGTAVGFILSGELANWSWRAGFMALAIPAGVLAWVVRRLREPARGGSGRLAPSGSNSADSKKIEASEELLQKALEKAEAHPRPDLIPDKDPGHETLGWAFWYVLRIPTNRILITASALGYLYFSGMRTFGVEYMKLWFHMSHALATILAVVVGTGAIIGVLTSGRFADALIARGHVNARLGVAAAMYLAAILFFVPALCVRTTWLGLLLFFLASAALGGMNPPVDSARLDIVPPSLWGRAEAVRTFFRQTTEAIAPLAFGFMSEHWFGSGGPGNVYGLHWTFLSTLCLYLVAGVISIFALRSYPRDVATAFETARKYPIKSG